MKIRDTYPHLVGAPTEQLLGALDRDTFSAVFRDLVDTYNDRLPLWLVMRSYGHNLGPDSDKVQVSCERPGHKNRDANKSARYFAFDQNNEKPWGHVYCYVCNTPLYVFWYIYTKEKAVSDGIRYSDLFTLIEKRYGVPFPRDLVLEFDPEAHFSLESEAAIRDDPGKRFLLARAIREELKGKDSVQLSRRLFALYMSGSVTVPHGHELQP